MHILIVSLGFTSDFATATLLAIWSEPIPVPARSVARMFSQHRESAFCRTASHFGHSIRSFSRTAKLPIPCVERLVWASAAYPARPTASGLVRNVIARMPGCFRRAVRLGRAGSWTRRVHLSSERERLMAAASQPEDDSRSIFICS